MLDNLKIGKRLGLGFGVALVMILILNLVSIKNLGSLNDGVNDSGT